MFIVPMSRSGGELARPFDRLFDDAWFDRFFAPVRSEAGGTRSPALDVHESDRDYTVTIDLPGVGKDDVAITVDGRRVSVEARVSRQQENKDGDRVVYSERSVASFARGFTLPQEVNEAESSAKLDNGVLTLVLAKRAAGRSAALKVE